jgi:peptidoglycan/LPS O-acetylase OafA/YrhL
MWSLSVEEQYYVVFPFLFLAGFWAGRLYLGPLMIAVFAVSLAACLPHAAV